MEKKLKVALHLVDSNSFLQKTNVEFLHTIHPIEGTQHQKNKN